MPGTTSLGIIYPCGGDTIDPGVFQDYAESTQDALDATQALIDEAFGPPTVLVATDTPGQVIAAGVTATVAYQNLTYDTAAMWNAGTPTLITVQSPGTYLVNLWSTRTVQPTTQTSARAAILVGGVERVAHKSDDGTASFSASPAFMVSSIFTGLLVGDQITSTFLFTGTGNITIRHSISVTKISNV